MGPKFVRPKVRPKFVRPKFVRSTIVRPKLVKSTNNLNVRLEIDKLVIV